MLLVRVLGHSPRVLHFRYQLLVIRFTVRTDHSSLRWLLSQDDLTGIRQRWAAMVDQEGIVDLDCYHLLSFQSLHARALNVDDVATSTSVSADEPTASVHDSATTMAANSEDVEVEQVSRVSMEDLTQTHAEGYASSMLSVTVELEGFIAAYQDCTDFKSIYNALHTSTEYTICLPRILCSSRWFAMF